MLMTTTDNIPGKNYEIIGVIVGNVVRTKHLGRDLMAGLKSLAGGELKGYTELLIESRNIATQRMFEEAKRMGADAIVCVRYESSSITQGASESMAYGTAVKFV